MNIGNIRPLAVETKLPYVYLWRYGAAVLVHIQEDDWKVTGPVFSPHCVAASYDTGEVWRLYKGRKTEIAYWHDRVYLDVSKEIDDIAATSPMIAWERTGPRQTVFYEIAPNGTREAFVTDVVLHRTYFNVSRDNQVFVYTMGAKCTHFIPGIIDMRKSGVRVFPQGVKVCSPVSRIPQGYTLSRDACRVMEIDGNVLGEMHITGGEWKAMAAVDGDVAVGAVTTTGRKRVNAIYLFKSTPPISQLVWAGVMETNDRLYSLHIEPPFVYVSALNWQEETMKIVVLHTEQGYLHTIAISLFRLGEARSYADAGLSVANAFFGMGNPPATKVPALRLAATVGLAASANIPGCFEVYDVNLPHRVEFSFLASNE